MLLQIGGQNGLDDQEPKTFELHVVQVDQEVELRPGHEEVPGWGSVVIFQNGPIVVQHSLHTSEDTQMHASTHTHSR